MGVKVEFNQELTFRANGTTGRKPEECLPDKLELDNVYPFLKEGQRNYWLNGEVPLRETKGNQQLSRLLASVLILEVTHFFEHGKVWTRGKYEVKEVYDLNDSRIHFEGLEKIK